MKSSSFAERMRNRRAQKERTVLIESGGIDEAWQNSWRMIRSQFGEPMSETRDGLDYVMVWGRDNTEAVRLNLGAVHSLMKRQSPRSVVQAIVTCHEEVITAPRTKISFVVTCSAEDYDSFERLEHWAESQNLPSLRVIKAPKKGKTLLYVRANGPTDWYGKISQEKTRPVMVFEIP